MLKKSIKLNEILFHCIQCDLENEFLIKNVFCRIGLCAFSGYKIYPGHGKTLVKVDGKVIVFVYTFLRLCSLFHILFFGLSFVFAKQCAKRDIESFVLECLKFFHEFLLIYCVILLHHFRFQSFTFLNQKCERSFLMKRNPRKVTWTVLYRRKHKKGIEEEAAKKRTRRTQKFQRAIVGASLTEILAKRNMKPEVRKAQRDQAIK